jgi:hypothetical protein
VAQAGPVIIEPISRLEVTVPVDVQGDFIGHLNTHRARVLWTNVGDAGEQVIEALVPTSELRRYAVDLRSLSRGRGTFHAEHDRYDVLPENLAVDESGPPAPLPDPGTWRRRGPPGLRSGNGLGGRLGYRGRGAAICALVTAL